MSGLNTKFHSIDIRTISHTSHYCTNLFSPLDRAAALLVLFLLLSRSATVQSPPRLHGGKFRAEWIPTCQLFAIGIIIIIIIIIIVIVIIIIIAFPSSTSAMVMGSVQVICSVCFGATEAQGGVQSFEAAVAALHR